MKARVANSYFNDVTVYQRTKIDVEGAVKKQMADITSSIAPESQTYEEELGLGHEISNMRKNKYFKDFHKEYSQNLDFTLLKMDKNAQRIKVEANNNYLCQRAYKPQIENFISQNNKVRIAYRNLKQESEAFEDLVQDMAGIVSPKHLKLLLPN